VSLDTKASFGEIIEIQDKAIGGEGFEDVKSKSHKNGHTCSIG
jgi:hypothetical protein